MQLRGVKLRSGRLGSLRGSSLAPHHTRDSAKELADLKAKNKKLAGGAGHELLCCLV